MNWEKDVLIYLQQWAYQVVSEMESERIRV